MSDRPSQHPTRRGVLPVIPRAPRTPQVNGQPVAPVDRAPVIAAGNDDPPSSSTPTSPPPPTFTELRKLSGHPSPMPPPPREEPRADSRSFTLPGPHSVPRLLIDLSDLNWFEVNDESRGLVPLIDGTRTVTRIAEERGIPPREAQLRIADLRARGIVEL